MATFVHNQRSNHSRVWFDLGITDNEDNTITIPAGSVWVRDVEYVMSALTSQAVGTGAFRVWIEDLGGGTAGYKTDTVLDETIIPTSFGEGIGALLVAWRDPDDTDIQYLHSIEE